MSTESKWTRVKRAASAQWQQVLAQHASPARLGWAVAWGVFVGCSAFLGLQTVLAMALAYPLRLNRVAVFAGLQISFPPMTAVWLFADAQLGEYLLHRTFLPVTLEGMSGLEWRTMGFRLFWDLLLGGTLIGAAVALILGWVTYRTARSRQGKLGPA